MVLGDFTDTSTTIDYARAICRVGGVVVEGGYQNPNAMFSPNDILIVSGLFFNSPTQSYGYQVTIATKTGTMEVIRLMHIALTIPHNNFF